MSFLSKFNLGKRIVQCPSCHKPLRIPTKSGTLRVTCPHCKSQFEVRVTNPIKEVFKYNSSKSVSQNLGLMLNRYKALPKNGKISLALLLVSILILVWLIMARATQVKEPVEKRMPPTSKTEIPI